MHLTPLWTHEQTAFHLTLTDQSLTESESSVVSRNQLNVTVKDNAGTGIKIRNRQLQSLPSTDNFVRQNVSPIQGNAPRRILLQRKLQVGSVDCHIETAEDWSFPWKEDSKSFITGVTSLPNAIKLIWEVIICIQRCWVYLNAIICRKENIQSSMWMYPRRILHSSSLRMINCMKNRSRPRGSVFHQRQTFLPFWRDLLAMARTGYLALW